MSRLFELIVIRIIRRFLTVKKLYRIFKILVVLRCRVIAQNFI